MVRWTCPDVAADWAHGWRTTDFVDHIQRDAGEAVVRETRGGGEAVEEVGVQLFYSFPCSSAFVLFWNT